MSNGKRKQTGPKEGIVLSEADYSVLYGAARRGLQTFRAIHAGPFKNRNYSATWKRMKRMVNEGLLRECKGDGDTILAWSITRKGVSELDQATQATWDTSKRGPVYKTAFLHDLTLDEIRGILEKSPAVKAWTSEHTLKAEAMRRSYHLGQAARSEQVFAVPDALLHFGSGRGGSKAALELELTQKSKRRLHQKLEAYVLSRDFDHAFFIAKDENLLTVLVAVYREVIARSPQVKFAKTKNGIYFTTLGLLRRKGLHANFLGPKGTMTFAELSA